MNWQKIKVFLVFFCFVFFLSCEEKVGELPITIIYKNGKAVQASIKTSKDAKAWQVFLKGAPLVPVLGKFSLNGGHTVFTPVLPFTNGASYQIKNGEQLMGAFTVISKKNEKRPKVIAIYPSNDSLPQNLLKMYFVFSEPIQEVGNIFDLITITNDTKNENANAFLELPNQLWNKEHTQLTLWLDPGRIKTDLIPNKTKGLPLEEGNKYTVTIGENLKSSKGMALGQSYAKPFYVNPSDRTKPSLSKWSVVTPKENTRDTLKIIFNEPLDAILGKETITIKNANGEALSGRNELSKNEEEFHFSPDAIWVEGTYEIEVLSILEDLAGNNLNHLFDRNITSSEGVTNERSMSSKHIKFTIGQKVGNY
ncbi:MAG: Ig-like domain-containing protein [Bacteroidota bacterium]